MVGTNDGIGFDIPDTRFFFHDGRPFANINTPRNKSATGRFSFSSIIFFAVVSQVFPQSSAVFFIEPDMLIDRFMADGALFFLG